MKRALERLLWFALGAATVWQIYASLARCGSIDGGALLVPMLMLAYALGRNSTKESDQRKKSRRWRTDGSST